MKYKIISLFLVLFCLPIHAKWVWTPQEGWINTKYHTRDTAKKLLDNGKQLKQKKQRKEAKESLRTAWNFYPDSVEGKEALLILADMELKDGRKYEAYLLYQQYIKKYPSTSHLQDILKKQYEIGADIIRKKTNVPPAKGIKILEDAITASPYADFTDDARMTVADYYFKQKQYQEAQTEYDALIKKHPKSEWIPAAKYQSAVCSYKEFKNIKLDSKPLKKAKKSMDKYIENNPDSGNIDLAKKKQKEITEKLAQKDISIAEFYTQEEKYHSARIYLYYVVKKYPRTRSAQKAKLLLKKLPKNEK